MSEEEKKEYEELKSLLYTGTISQYGKRKLIDIIEKQSKEIEEAEQKERKAYIKGTNDAHELCNKKWEDKIKAKIEEYEQDVKDFEEYWSKDPRKFKKEKSVDYYKLEALKELLEKE